jgi:hypothetical protein
MDETKRPELPEAVRDGQHWIHREEPGDNDPWRPGKVCGPWCDLFEDPEAAWSLVPETELRAMYGDR